MRFKKIYIEITNKCNLNCSFCPKLKRAPREMTVEEFEVVASQARNFSEFIYLHIKGEPLAHPQIDNILTICDRLDFKVNITTNGTLLAGRCDILKKHKSLRQISISLHSMESPEKAEIYVNNIINSAEILSENSLISYRIWTYDEGKSPVNEKILKVLQQYYNKEISICRKRTTLKNNIYFSLGDTFLWPSPLLPECGDTGFCYGTRSHIGILSDGTVVPCCLDSEGYINLGNVFEEKLSDILEKERFLCMNKGFSERKIIEPLCKKCSFRLRFGE